VLTSVVARYLFKLMAYKDEYEVARLYTDTDFLHRVASRFEGDYQLKLHLAPPLWAKTDPATGEPRKRTYGAWMLGAMRILARLRGLRGTPLDVFGYNEERRTERRLIADYERVVEELLQALDAGRVQLAAEIASIPEFIRGYGPVKARHLRDAKVREAQLLAEWRNPSDAALKARIPIRVAA
jgi:indolepyruvate ferredoxin oxidoreductase